MGRFPLPFPFSRPIRRFFHHGCATSEVIKSSQRCFKTPSGCQESRRLPSVTLEMWVLASRLPTDVNSAYVDKKCPFTGNVSIRGRILTGVITKMKMHRTVIIRRDYLHYIKKYNRFEKRHKNMAVHLSPCFRDVKCGDVATVGECRPLSKTVKFNTLKVSKGSGNKKAFKKF